MSLCEEKKKKKTLLNSNSLSKLTCRFQSHTYILSGLAPNPQAHSMFHLLRAGSKYEILLPPSLLPSAVTALIQAFAAIVLHCQL